MIAFSADVTHSAWLDALSATAEHPVIGVAPSRNATVPFVPGSPSAAATVAVKVTVEPYTLGLVSTMRLVVVGRTRLTV